GPKQGRAVLRFRPPYQINADLVVGLPVGKGHALGGNSGSVADALIAGWELSGLARWTSGFPFTVDNGNNWATDWDEQGIAQMVARPAAGRYKANGVASVFANPAAAFADFQNPFPGQGGSRNVV